jgi:ribose transport system substrate-binding protein
MADEAIVDSGGKANLVVVMSQDIPDSLQVRDGVKAEFGELCPACKMTVLQTTVANWSSQIPTLVRTALTADPTIGYFAPTFDGMVQFVVPAIRAAGAADKVKIVTSTTTPSVMDLLAKHDIVLADVDVLAGDWMSWAWMDQSIRLITGASPVKFTQVPTRVFDRTNIGSINPDAPSTSWFSTDFRAEYKKLWGVS